MYNIWITDPFGKDPEYLNIAYRIYSIDNKLLLIIVKFHFEPDFEHFLSHCRF